MLLGASRAPPGVLHWGMQPGDPGRPPGAFPSAHDPPVGTKMLISPMENVKKYEPCTPMLLLVRRMAFSYRRHENAYFPDGKREEV